MGNRVGRHLIILFLVIIIGILPIFSGCVEKKSSPATPTSGMRGEYYIEPKIVPIYMNQSLIGEVYGGVTVEVSSYQPIQSGYVLIEIEGWIWKDILQDSTPGNITKLKSEDSLWIVSRMVMLQGKPNYINYRVAMLKPGTSVEVLELEKGFARYAKIRTTGIVEEKFLASQRKVKKSQQGQVRDVLTNGNVSVWLTDVMLNYHEGVHIVFQIKNEGSQKQKIFAIRTTVFGAGGGSSTQSITRSMDPKVDKLQEMISLGPGETTYFEFD